MTTTAQLIGIGEAAAAAGITAHTLRYYEREGLMLEPPERASSTHRRYSPRDLQWISLLTKLRATGMPIRDMRRYAELVRAGEGNEAERLALLSEHRQAVLAQLAEVKDNLAAIDRKIVIYQEKVSR